MASPSTPSSSSYRLPDSGRLSLGGRFALIVALFVTIALLVLVFTYGAIHALSATRAYVGGGGRWSRAQKDTVYQLRKYADTRDPEDVREAFAALRVIAGDRRARLELLKEEPDMVTVYEGFLEGGNDPEDLAGMVWLFRRLRSFAVSEEALAVWETADRRIEALESAAWDLEAAVRKGAPEAEVEAILERIDRLDDELTILEDDFADVLGVAARELSTALLWTLAVTTALLLGTGTVLSGMLLRSVKRANEALAESEQRYRALVETSAVGIWQVAPEGETIYLNPAMRDMLEIERRSDIHGVSYERFFTEESRERIERERPRRHVGEGSTYEVEIVGARGGRRTALLSGAPILASDGTLRSLIGTFVDITERKAAEELLEHQALHDPLTDLPNRTLLLDRLDQALVRLRRRSGPMAVLFVDLDGFKTINDRLGHAAGDRLLKSAARRLGAVVRREDTVARLGGDEFAVLLEELDGPQVAVETAERLIEAAREPLDILGTRTWLTVSVGVTVNQDPDERVDNLLRHADLAMFAAKRAGGDRYHLHEPGDDEGESLQLELEGDLWRAAERGELTLLYQPIVALATGEAAGVEALLRWEHPERGRIPPGDFIPVAEESGAIVPIGRWALETACRQMARWREAGRPRVPRWVSVNLSLRQFRLVDVAQELEAVLAVTGLARECLRLEVPEALLTQRPEAARRLRELGLTLSLDRFGSGQSSLAALHTAVIQHLKLDPSFVTGLDRSPEDAALLSALIQLAKAFRLSITAPGVETEEQREILEALGCDLVQGRLFAAPLPAGELAALLEHPPWRG